MVCWHITALATGSASGLQILGAPAPALLSSARLPIILAGCVARSTGVEITTVIDSSTVAWLVPADRRGEALELYGVVGGIPAIVGLPPGAWLAGHVGYWLVFSVGALLPLAPVANVPAVKDPRPAARSRDCPCRCYQRQNMA